jgi:hypothetical protein
MKKLNFGCGARYAAGWMNIDFHSDGQQVQRVNLLAGFPFPDNTFDVVYSSHVLEHFTSEQAAFLVRESHRVLKAGGIIRAVVPDLEASVREYMRILAMNDSDPDKLPRYNWIKIELLDQLVRTTNGGAMGALISAVADGGDEKMSDYIESRTESHICSPHGAAGARSALERISLGKIVTKSTYVYLGIIKRLIPKNLRPMVWNGTSIGERHRWMYDRFGLKQLMQDSGFTEVRFLSFNESAIPGFLQDGLDANQDGTPYKNTSIYCEASKP